MDRIGIIGSTGYVGMELVRLINRHPKASLSCVVSSSHAGKPYSDVYPFLKNVVNIECDHYDPKIIADKCDIVFAALPHSVSQDIIPEILDEGVRVIDLSADYRYNDPLIYQQWYGVPHKSPQLLTESVYGLPELHRDDITEARLVGNPGCYTTCSILALAPLVKEGIIDIDTIIIDAKSGVSGAGRSTALDNSFCECTENFKAYKIAAHRHTSEIEQELSLLAGKPLYVTFSPHLTPMRRGILATCYATLTTEITAAKILELYNYFYDGEPFVRLYAGSLPETNHVTGSNFVDIGVVVDTRCNRVVVVSCIDNLVKGAAGQAVQNMNILMGIPETLGLFDTGIYL